VIIFEHYKLICDDRGNWLEW